MNNKCFIFGALEVGVTPLLPCPDDFIIAADKGLVNATAHNIKPDVIIGDFDSLGVAPKGESVITLPTKKDDTDVGYAIKFALNKGFKDFVIYGVLGGLLDHTLANLQLASFIANKGGSCILVGGGISATVIKNSTVHFDGGSGRLSVLCLSENAEGVNISGALYTLKDATLTRSFPLGVSNSFLESDVTVSVENGTIAVLWENAKTPEFI